MLNRLGIYDLFAHMLPGAIYMSATIMALNLWPLGITIPFSKLNASVLALFIAISYLIGILMSPIKWTPWDGLFPSPDLNKALRDLQHTYPEVTLNINQNQWPVLQANSALENLDFSLAVDKLRATYIMLRSVSLALCVFVVIAIVYAVGHWESIISWFGAFITLGASALAVKASRMFSSCTFRYTIELMIARVIEPEDFVTRKIKCHQTIQSNKANSADAKSRAAD